MLFPNRFGFAVDVDDSYRMILYSDGTSIFITSDDPMKKSRDI